MNLGDLYYITDSRMSRKGIADDVREAINAGVSMIQYRENSKPIEEMLEEAGKIKAICREKSTLFIVNNHINIAMDVGADGVHLGQGDTSIEMARRLMPNKIVGLSATTLKEALKAEKDGADYIGAGPVFVTSTKKDAAKPMGAKTLKEIKSKVGVPVVAVGGITRENLKEVMKSGVDSIVMMSAVANSENPGKEIKAVIRTIRNMRSEE